MNEGSVRLRARSGENWDWQPIREPDEDKSGRERDSFPYLSSYYAILVLIAGVALYEAVALGNAVLPTPLTIKDKASHPDTFIAEHALIHLRHLTSFGPKPTGSYENEVLAVDFLTREISFIMQQASAVQKISFDLQKPTGSYLLGFKPGFTNYYSNVQNIVVKLSSEGNVSSSLLINCHFDTVPTSPGGSDDGLNCAVMLEVLRVLSRANTRLKHNVIFLFNGAEETPLQASHGFISQHKWAQEVKAFINLESCGAGGKEVLFQAGPNHPWLIQMYADSVPHPHGVVLGEEIFQSGLIPSDTDFRVFRDFGNVPGMDFAHWANGYVYHTSFDNMDYIPLGTYQHTGDNLLALTRKLASSTELGDPQAHSAGKAIYFDVIGMWMVSYSEMMGIGLNIVIALLSIFTQMNTMLAIGRALNQGQMGKLLLLGCGFTFLGWLLGISLSVVIAILLDALNSSMSWYSRPVFIFGLYYCPVLACCMVFPVLFNKYKKKQKNVLSHGSQVQWYCNCAQLLWTVLLLIATIFRVRSAFVLMLLLLFPVISSLLLIAAKYQRSPRVWLSVYLGAALIPILYIFYLTMMTYSLFIPITGRMGSEHNPELIVAIFTALVCILASSYVTPLILLVKSPGKVLMSLGIFHLLTLAAVVLTPIGFPYSGNPVAPSPQRILVFHTDRTFYDPMNHIRYNDSGYWLMNWDRHSPDSVRALIPEVAKAQSVKPFCDTELYCGLPLYTSRLLRLCNHTHWIPAPRPVVHIPTSLDLVSQKMVSMNTRRMTFTVSGPDRMEIFLSPFVGVKLVQWSFSSEITSGEPKWKNRSTYFIHYTHGLMGPPLEFWVEFQVPSPLNTTILDIALVGHYMNHPKSPEFKHFLKRYPNWTDVMGWSATYKGWQF